MNPEQQPPSAARAALESLYYDQATELCDLCPLAESGDDRMHGMHLAIMEALADAHEAGRAEVPPAPTIGGPMPEPWPGMGVEVEGGGMTLVPLILARDGDEWIGLPAPGAPMMKSIDVTAIYDGRRCIWRRE